MASAAAAAFLVAASSLLTRCSQPGGLEKRRRRGQRGANGHSGLGMGGCRGEECRGSMVGSITKGPPHHSGGQQSRACWTRICRSRLRAPGVWIGQWVQPTGGGECGPAVRTFIYIRLLLCTMSPFMLLRRDCPSAGPSPSLSTLRVPACPNWAFDFRTTLPASANVTTHAAFDRVTTSAVAVAAARAGSREAMAFCIYICIYPTGQSCSGAEAEMNMATGAV